LGACSSRVCDHAMESARAGSVTLRCQVEITKHNLLLTHTSQDITCDWSGELRGALFQESPQSFIELPSPAGTLLPSTPPKQKLDEFINLVLK